MEVIQSKYAGKFAELLQLQQQIAGIHPMLEEHYPIVVVEEGRLHIFEYEEGSYRLSLAVPDPYHMPVGVRAAFPLEALQYRAAVFVSGEVFDRIEEQVIVFHEFVHCYQFHTCELQLRQQFELGRTGPASWELDYPFPYESEAYIACTRELFEALDQRDGKRIGAVRQKLRASLTAEQIEYMVWQEWKEGLARYIENRIKKQLSIAPVLGGRVEPYRRTTFYETGALLIDYIVSVSPRAHAHIDELFDALRDDRYFV